MAEAQRIQLRRKILFLAAIVFDAVLATGLVAHWFRTPAAWSVLASASAAVISGALAIGGDTLKSSSMSRRPLTAAVSLFVALAVTAVATLFGGGRTVSGRATASKSDENAVDAAPFVVGIDAFAAGGCGTYRFEQPVDALAPLPRIGSGNFASWLSEHKAIQSLPYGRFTGAKLIVNITGDTDSPVTITDVSFRTLGIKPFAPEGAAISGQCGGETVGRFMEVDLDKSPPKVLATNDDPNGTWGAEPVELTPIRFPYTVRNGDSEPFYVIAETHEYVEYVAQIDWIYEGKAGSTTVDDHGKPFRVAAAGPGASPTQGWG